MEILSLLQTLWFRNEEENNEVLKYLWEDIALYYAVLNEFHVLGILFSVMSVEKKIR